MPVKSCRTNGRPGYKWGDSGKCYGYTSGDDKGRRKAKRKAIIQGIAAGERPSASSLTVDLHHQLEQVEQEHLPSLVAEYEEAIQVIASDASKQFALVSAASDWQPPAEGAIITHAEVVAVALRLNRRSEPVWERIVEDTAQEPLARIEIDWTVKHPLAENLLAQAGRRTGQRLDAAVQFTLRETLAHAYEQGLNVLETSRLIQQRIAGAAPFQADMLARTDLNSLANGASHAAAQLAEVGYKTWLATLDDKTRVEHADAHGQVVSLNDTFLVGGEDADYPGDPALSDAMAANCRCTVAYGDTLEEAEGLTASGLRTSDEGSIMAGMKTRTKRKHGRTTAAAKPAVRGGTSANSNASFTVNDTLKPNTDIALVASPRAIPFTGTAAIEGLIADDNSLTPRVLLPNSLSWNEMPVPFMAQTVTAEGHDGAEVAGRVDQYSRNNGVGKKKSITMSGELTTPFGIIEIAPMIEDKTLRYVSVDLGATEWAIVGRSDLSEIPMEQLNLDDLEAGKYALGLKAGKIKATTLVPTQALEGALVALSASAEDKTATITFEIELELGEKHSALVASPAPRNPPLTWFETQEPPGKMPLTVMKDGRVYGHLATWDSCHASFLPQCVPPPRSPSNYARFHHSCLETDSGEDVYVGKLMFSPTGGHADRRLSAAAASAHYDKTGMAAAYLRAHDGKYGIWVAGAINPDLTDAQREEMRRELRLNPPSGDWRPYDGQLDLLCGLAVAIPGFGVMPSVEVTVVASANGVETKDALIASSGVFEADPAAVAAMEHLGLVNEDVEADRKMEALAARAKGLEALARLAE